MIVLRVNWNLNYHWRPNAERRKDPAWNAYRAEIFQRYTLASLQRQAFTDWRVWLICDPELAFLTEPMRETIGEPRVRCIYSLSRTYTEWRETAGPLDIYARIDSDDMLHPEALTQWVSETSGGLVQFGNGYALDLRDGRVFEWNHFSSPFIADIGCTGDHQLGGNHGQVHQVARRIDDGRWHMVTVHGDNVCNQLPCNWSGRRIHGTERETLLNEFGVQDRWARTLCETS